MTMEEEDKAYTCVCRITIIGRRRRHISGRIIICPACGRWLTAKRPAEPDSPTSRFMDALLSFAIAFGHSVGDVSEIRVDLIDLLELTFQLYTKQILTATEKSIGDGRHRCGTPHTLPSDIVGRRFDCFPEVGKCAHDDGIQ